jgi:AAA domain, putative AbiEii toxin, Type IV TA system/AAA ATPase domain
MLSSVRLQGFKSFTDATVKLAPLTVLIGANGSGKSNFVEALDLCDRLWRGVDPRVAVEGDGLLTPIRGGFRSFKSSSTLTDKVYKSCAAIQLMHQNHSETFDFSDPTQPIQKDSPKQLVSGFARHIDRIQVLNLVPDVLRKYNNLDSRVKLDSNGYGFSTIAAQICAEPKTKQAFLDWLEELRPDQIADVEVRSGAVDDVLFGVVEKHGGWLGAPALSDGTLRFAALVVALFQHAKPKVLCIEEIENGMHPARMILLIDLLRTFTRNGVQVIVTTHAPWLLSWLNADELAAVQWFYRDESGASCVKSLSEHSFAMDALKQGRIDQLFATGYLEQAQ